MDEIADAKERYHFAKLALFNVRFLDVLERQNSMIPPFIASEAKKNGFSDSPSLMNQVTFLQFAYVCIVWLWESAERTNYKEKLIERFPGTTSKDKPNLPTKDQIKGKRALNDWESVLRFLRNALSHGRVKVTDDFFFIFSEQGRNESVGTELKLSGEQLGRISEAVIHSFTLLLWPTNPSLPL